MLFARLGPALSDIRAAVDELNSFRATPFGTVRINVPNSIARFVLGDAMELLLKRNPGLKLEVVATDTLVDIVREGFDAGIRFGERVSQDMIAVRIRSKFRSTVVGSPSYFEGRQVPTAPHDLRNHSCIRYAFPSGTIFPWEFSKGGETVQVEVNGPLTLDSQELMVDAAARGLGLAYVGKDRAEPYLHDGRLKACLEDWCSLEEGLFSISPAASINQRGLERLLTQ